MGTLAVLIPAYNEARNIASAVWSCYQAGLSGRDIYVCDDGSTDETAAIAGAMNVQVVMLPNGGKASAIHRGLLHFTIFDRYDWVTILDADCRVAPSYFEELRRVIRTDPSVALISGNQRSQRHNWLTAWRAVEHAVCGGVYREAQHWLGAIVVVPGLCSTFRTAVFRTLDFGRGTLVEDMDWTIQLQRQGERIVYAPNAHVYSQDPRTLHDYIGQILRWYQGTWQVIRLHRLGTRAERIDAETWGLTAENLLYGAFIILLPLWVWLIPKWVGWGFAFDQTILLTYTLLVAARERRTDVLKAFPLFCIPRLLNIALFPWAYLTERRRPETKWFSVARY